MYYPYSENKGADQLRGYREADLRLCFRICEKPGFSRRGSYFLHRRTDNKWVFDDNSRINFNSFQKKKKKKKVAGTNRGIKHDFPFFNICKVRMEVLKTEGEARGFQHFPSDLANVNE